MRWSLYICLLAAPALAAPAEVSYLFDGLGAERSCLEEIQLLETSRGEIYRTRALARGILNESRLAEYVRRSVRARYLQNRASDAVEEFQLWTEHLTALGEENFLSGDVTAIRAFLDDLARMEDQLFAAIDPEAGALLAKAGNPPTLLNQLLARRLPRNAEEGETLQDIVFTNGILTEQRHAAFRLALDLPQIFLDKPLAQLPQAMRTSLRFESRNVSQATAGALLAPLQAQHDISGLASAIISDSPPSAGYFRRVERRAQRLVTASPDQVPEEARLALLRHQEFMDIFPDTTHEVQDLAYCTLVDALFDYCQLSDADPE